jgi:hypothetical protein
MAVPMAQAPAGLPYALGNRCMIEAIASKVFTPGGAKIDVELAKVGYLYGVALRLSGTLTTTAGISAPLAGFPYDLLARITLDIPGINDPVSISGSMLHLQNFADHGLSMVLPGILAFDTDQMVSVAEKAAGFFTAVAPRYPVAAGANVWNAWLWLPAIHNQRDMRGILPLGNAGTSRVTVSPAALADVFGTPGDVASSALVLDFFQFYFTAPPIGVQAPNTAWAVVFDEYEQSEVATGARLVDIPKGGIILNVVHSYRNVNTAFPIASDVVAQVEALSFRANRDKYRDVVPLAVCLLEQNVGRTIPYPAGSFVYDFDAKQTGIPFADAFGERIPGWLYSDDLVEIKSTLHVPVGATQTVAKIRTAVKRLMPVASG